jgi:hypothetical protein
VGCVSDPDEIASVLYEHVLEAASRAYERNALLSRAPDDL